LRIRLTPLPARVLMSSPLCDVVPSRRWTPSEHGSHRPPMSANSGKLPTQ
jgi:hypothetical protein